MLVEAPIDEAYDAFGIVPREGAPKSPFGRSIQLSTDALDLNDAELDGLDPFGIVAKGADAKTQGAPPPSQKSAPAGKGPPPAAKPAAQPAPKPAPPRAGASTPESGSDELDDEGTSTASGGKRAARLRISYKKASTFVKEYKRNLKRGGTFVKTKKPLEVGRGCILHLTVPGWTAPIEIVGSVVWSSKGIEVMAGQEEGMGIKFDGGDAAGLGAAQSAVDSLEASGAP
jgi:type IV pilus assembly protein PilZ